MSQPVSQQNMWLVWLALYNHRELSVRVPPAEASGAGVIIINRLMADNFFK